MTEDKIARTFTTKMPDKPGAFMLACKVIMNNNGNIVRVSYNRGVNLFIEVLATREELNKIDRELSEISYVDYMPKEPTVLVISVRIVDEPGALFPVLEVIDKYDVNISYLNSLAENKGYQNFNIGMEVENPEVSKKILDEVARIYPLDIVSYNGNDPELDNTVEYIRVANNIQKLFSLPESKLTELILESKSVSDILCEKGYQPIAVFKSFIELANFIAFHKDLNFKPRITDIQLTEDTELHVIEPPCGSNTYVLRNNDELLFIDTGLGIYSDEMITELREMFPCFFSMEKTVIATHADVDHSGLLSVIENAKIYISKGTSDYVAEMGKSKVPSGDFNPYSYSYGRIGSILTDYIDPSEESIHIFGEKRPELKKPLERIDTFRFGDIEFEIYEGNGGHLKGETVLFSRNPKLLFTGDIYSNLNDLTSERADLENIAPYLMTNVDVDKKKLDEIREELGKLMDSVGRDDMIVCGGHGAIKKL